MVKTCILVHVTLSTNAKFGLLEKLPAKIYLIHLQQSLVYLHSSKLNDKWRRSVVCNFILGKTISKSQDFIILTI